MINIKGLHKYFNKGKQNEIHVINGIDLELPEKGMIAIFGKSGCGKTTILNVIGGLDGFSGGTVTLDGQDIRQDTDVIRNKYIGYIFQNYNLNKQESCFDNVADALRLCGMSDETEINERVMAALANVGMDKYSKRPPDTLSGGQQQRIAIARAIVKNPQIILADEPTGNLDEANTVMIMDLLKAISKDHLVLLVTHEANLVDYYCDKVIELSDGKVVSVRDNKSANGLYVRDKNDIYLGELQKRTISDANAEVEYYGDAIEAPVKLKIINNGGKIYLQVDSSGVQIIDEFSEMNVKEGVFEQKETTGDIYKDIDMSKLPPVKGERFGSLFSFRSSLKSGYSANFKKSKRGKKMLKRCMCLFAAVVVFMSAVFGTALGDIINVSESYNHNVFYVYTPDGEVSAKINDAVDSADSGIDYVRMFYDYPDGDMMVRFDMGSFETFSVSSYSEEFMTNAVWLDSTLAKGLKTVAGKSEGLKDTEILITTKVADALLEKSSLGYIEKREDLVGIMCRTFAINGKTLRVAGVVESDETAVYLTPMAMARYLNQGNAKSVLLASDYGFNVSEGEVVFSTRSKISENDPKIGETVKVRGMDVKVSAINSFMDYDEWLKKTYPTEYFIEEDFYNKKVLEEDPSLEFGTNAYYQALDEMRMTGYFDYLEAYNSRIEEYLRAQYVFNSNDFQLWLFMEKGIEEMKYFYMMDGAAVYFAEKYKAEHGAYPLRDDIDYNFYHDQINGMNNEYHELYIHEFNSTHHTSIPNVCFLVSDADYIAVSKRIGDTDKRVTGNNGAYMGGYMGEVIYDGGGMVFDMDMSEFRYTLIHSNDPKLTEDWIAREFADLTTPQSYLPSVLTPSMLFDEKISENTTEIVINLVAMLVILVLMGICMYFIMRSSLMNRIKEIGIYRAIGVSKKNLVFRFLIESLLLTTLTVFIGYIVSSAFIFICLDMSSMIEGIFFYPIWLAGIVLAILYALCVFFGILPIKSLLRKTPSEILSKYDI